ncbi:MAG: aromatic amino acid transaminase [Mariniblastus sp.]
MFKTAPLNPPDAIFGLIEQFKKDTNPNKINLSVGVYQDESGKTPVMKCVRLAEKKLLDAAGTKSYLPIDGSPSYRDAIGRLILGDELFDKANVHSVSAQTPGGTVSLRIAGELLRRVFEVDTIWMSNPTWANHPKIYGAAGLNVQKYDYLDDNGTGLGFDRMIESLQQTQPGQAILLHTVCHNPTGVDPSQEQWQQLATLVKERELFPIFDFAYQGFGTDLNTDAFPIRHFVEAGGEALVCNSFSKNFGLYAERVGGITAVSQNADVAAAMLSQIKLTIRTMYSNPPLHGGSIVDTVLHDAELRQVWETELAEVRGRILQLRSDFVAAMQKRLPEKDFEYINKQQGMFSYSGLTKDQVDRLREEYSIYALGSGRINIAGINAANLDRICDAIESVV